MAQGTTGGLRLAIDLRMMRGRDIGLWPWLICLAGVGCGGYDQAIFSGGADEGGVPRCESNRDCPAGLICRDQVCVSPEDLLPPDVETSRVVGRPVASSVRLFTLATDAHALLVLDPSSLALESVPVPSGPEALAVIPGQEVALVLSGEARALTLVDLNADLRVETVRLPRRYRELSVSPDGNWAVLWTPDGVAPEDGAEGLISLVNLDALSRGQAEPIEIAAGFRHTDVHFVVDGVVATAAVVLSKSAATVVRFEQLRTPGYRPQRILLPSPFAEVIGREVAAVPGADVLLLTSLGTQALAIVDVASSTVSQFPLPGRASDIDLAPGGQYAVLALRGQGQVGILPMQDILSSTDSLRLIDVPGLVPGQIEVSSDGGHAAVFSTQDGSERFAWLDLQSGELVIMDQIDKEVQSIALSPDGTGALVVHKANPDSTIADDYERAVDQDEGYSLVELQSGFAQLKRTASAAPVEVAFGASGQFAALTIRNELDGEYHVEVADFSSLIVHSLELASSPQFMGALPESEKVWVTQLHPAGRISVVDLDTRRLQTLTGFQLNSEIISGGGQ